MTANKQQSIRVHLVEDERPVKMILERDLDGEPTLVAIHSGDKAANLFNQEKFDTIELGFELPGQGRIETQRMQTEADGSEFVLLNRREENHGGEIETGEIEVLLTEERDGSGYEFLTRPLSARDLDHIAVAVQERKRQPGGRARTWRSPILGDSAPMRELLELVSRVAAGKASILIHGETGTGKTLIAREIHERSPRADERFVAINCSAFQDQLLESELFGHEKGSFTGANLAKPGLFEIAHKGTLFLDEVSTMSPAMQAKLLQVLDEGELRRVGGTKTRRVDVRILAASNRDLQQEVKKNEFREDLLFRLNVINLQVPRLAERTDDIPALVGHFLHRFRLPGRAQKQMSPEALKLLMSYHWPGNVRELSNTVEGLILLAPGDVIRAEDLPQNLRPASDFSLGDPEKPLPMSEMERLHIAAALRYTEGKKAPAARLLGIDVKTLRSKIQNYGIEV